jgi:hypothetical protein
MSASVKAGLIGAAAAVVLALLSLIPCVGVGCIAAILGLLIYIGAGALAAYWTDPPRATGDCAGKGAIAGLITSAVGGVVSGIINAARFAITGGTANVMSQLPPEAIQQLRDAGIDPAIFAGGGGIAAVLGVSAVCCLVGLALAAGLGAAGGAIMASVKSD